MKPLAIDLFTGLHGWAEGLTAEGYDVVGFDLEDMCGQFGVPRPKHVHLVIQDVLTLHGSQFKSAALIVASPPCQEYSYMAMPWTKAKAKAAAIRADTTGAALERLNRLFNACFRIQREACEAAGRHVPLVVENVKGAQPWVGRARWNFGSFYLWGDVPALMPPAAAAIKVKTMGAGWYPPDHPKHVPGLGFNTHAERAIKNNGGSRFNIGSPGQKVTGKNPVHELTGRKQGGDWFAEARKGGEGGTSASFGSKSPQRKMASAMIAKIPLPLSRHIAATYARLSEAA
jgi:hypothetical protein